MSAEASALATPVTAATAAANGEVAGSATASRFTADGVVVTAVSSVADGEASAAPETGGTVMFGVDVWSTGTSTLSIFSGWTSDALDKLLVRGLLFPSPRIESNRSLKFAWKASDRSGSRAAVGGSTVVLGVDAESDAEYIRQKTRMVSVKFPMSNSADVTRCRMSLLVSLDAGCLPSGVLHVGQSQHAPPVSRRVLIAFAVIFAHLVCQLLAQNSHRIFVPREPASQHATTSIFPVLGIFE